MKLFQAYVAFCKSLVERLCRATGLSNFFFAKVCAIIILALGILAGIGLSPLLRLTTLVFAVVFPIGLWRSADIFERRLESRPNAHGLSFFNNGELAALVVVGLITSSGGVIMIFSSIFHRDWFAFCAAISFGFTSMGCIFMICVTPPRTPYRRQTKQPLPVA